MLTKKQVMFLRGLANHKRPTHQIGKDGLTTKLVEDILLYLNKHELTKISMLQTCPLSKEEIEHILYINEIELVQRIGNTFVVYKYSADAKEPIVFE